MRAWPSGVPHSAGVRPSKGAALKLVNPWAWARRAVATKPSGVRRRVARLMLAYSATCVRRVGPSTEVGWTPRACTSRLATACSTALVTVLPTRPPGDCGDTRNWLAASSSERPSQSGARCAAAATSIGSQPIREASPQPTAPSLSVTAMKTQLVLGETLKTWVSMRVRVFMGHSLPSAGLTSFLCQCLHHWQFPALHE